MFPEPKTVLLFFLCVHVALKDCIAFLPSPCCLHQKSHALSFNDSNKYFSLVSVYASSSAEDQPVREGSSIRLGGSRRDLLSFAITSASAVTLACGILNNPAYAEDIGSSANPIVILGAGGKVCLCENVERTDIRNVIEFLLTTNNFIWCHVCSSPQVGKLCTQILASKKLYVRAVTRNGRSVLPEQSPFVSYVAADVTKLDDALISSMKGASGAIFTASASKNGGDAAHVDYLGVYNSAKAAIATKTKKLVGKSRTESLAIWFEPHFGYSIRTPLVFLLSFYILLSSLSCIKWCSDPTRFHWI